MTLRGIANLLVAGATGLALASPALGQTSGGLEGRVLDALTEAPIAVALVVATSPALPGEQTTVTDARGEFTLALLPSGIYELRITHDAFVPASANGIAVVLGRAARAQIFLVPASMKSLAAEVRGTKPILILDSQGATTITREQMELVPYGRDARSFEAAALAAPEVASDLYGLQIRGSSSPESSVLIDGVNVSDVNFGFQGTSLLQDFVEQVEVKSGGFRAEYGRSMGGIVNAVTKGGSNEFHGSVFFHGSPLELARTPLGGDGEAIALLQAQRYNLDFGATLGGPILKDRLWFFAGFAPQLVSSNVDRIIQARREGPDGKPLLGADGYALTDEVARTRYVRTQTSWMFAGKLTWQPVEEHRLTLAVYGNPTRATGPNDLTAMGEIPVATLSAARIRANEGAFLFDTITGSTDVSLIYQGRLFDRTTLLEASAGLHRQTRDLAFAGVQGVPAATLAVTPFVGWSDTRNLLDPSLQDPTTPAAQRGLGACSIKADGFDPCPVTGYGIGGVGKYDATDALRLSLGVKLTHLIGAGWSGRHQLKYGADLALDRMDKSTKITGGSSFFYQADGTFAVDSALDPLTFPLSAQQVAAQGSDWMHRLTRGASLAAFVQDSWMPLESLVVDLGLRVERQLLYSDRAMADPTTNAPVQGAQLALTNVMPRLGISWDFTGRGLARAYAAAGRYYESIPLSVTYVALSSKSEFVGSVSATACTAGASPVLPRDPRFCQGLGSYNFGGQPTQVDPNLGGQYLDEVQSGVQVQLMRNLAVGLEYTHRSLGRVIEDSTSDYSKAFWITNPGEPGSQVQIVMPDGSLAIPTRLYDSLTFSLNKAFGQGTLLNASYTFSSLRGNYPGLFVRENGGQVWPNSNSTMDSAIFFTNANGPLDGDSQHAFKLDGGWTTQLGPRTTLQLGAAFRAQQGAPVSYLSGWLSVPVLFMLPRGAGGRLPWVAQLDARAAITRDLGGGVALAIGLDVFNLLNAQTATATDQAYTFQDVVPLSSVSQLGSAQVCTRGSDLMSCQPNGQPLQVNPRWGRPTAYQLPLSLRLGARLTF